jgi:phospholipase C
MRKSVVLTMSVGAIAALTLAGIQAHEQDGRARSRPIQHLVVIFQENVSFDHYFATYPEASNPAGEPAFHPLRGTPSVNGLGAGLLTRNPNAVNPFRFSRAQAATCDQGHDYTQEQLAFNHGLMDKFVEFTGNGAPGCDKRQVMGYFDGNTVTALWNYAQHFAMSDNSFNTTFGPSTPGALNLISGQTNGAFPPVPGETIAGTVIGDPQPTYDDCTTRDHVAMSGRNVGDLLNDRGVTWGWFEGGFAATSRSAAGKAVCGAMHVGSDGKPKRDYIPHHQPFQYYLSTANPHHLPPTAVSAIGTTDQANHQYDVSDFWRAAESGYLPAVSFVKAPAYQDGHAGYSDPLAEQRFLVETINRLQRLPEWDHTAVVIAYDDSDGWYDHVASPILSRSTTPADALSDAGQCGIGDLSGAQGRCGYGPRLPLLVISPYAKTNFVDHATTDQASILRFIEDNWRLGRIGGGSFDEIAGPLDNLFDFSRERAPRLWLEPATGLQVTGGDEREGGRIGR